MQKVSKQAGAVAPARRITLQQPVQGPARDPIEPSPYSYVEYLAAELDAAGDRRKGERTRLRILAVTARLLDDHGYRALRQAQICDGAEIGVATFYQYFNDKLDACKMVLAGLLDFMQSADDPAMAPLADAARTAAEPYLGIFHANLGTLRLMRANTGLYRCFLETVGETDDMLRMWRDFSYRWYERAVRRMVERGVAADGQALMFRTILAGGMVDEFLRALLPTEPNPFAAIARDVHADDARLAQSLSIAWHRIVLGRDPDPGALTTALLLANGPAGT